VFVAALYSADFRRTDVVTRWPVKLRH
jgi:hypothetical protein